MTINLHHVMDFSSVSGFEAFMLVHGVLVTGTTWGTGTEERKKKCMAEELHNTEYDKALINDQEKGERI